MAERARVRVVMPDFGHSPSVYPHGVLATTSSTAYALGVIAAGLTVVMCIAQAIRMVRVGTRGVSRGTWLLNVAAAVVWLTYGLVFHVGPEIVANAPYLLLSLTVLFVASVEQNALPSSFVGLVVIVGGSLLGAICSLKLGWTWALIVPATTIAAILPIPQLVMTFRETNLSGISWSAWVITAVNGASWGLYGALTRRGAMIIPQLVVIPASLIIAFRALRYQRIPEGDDLAVHDLKG